MSTFKRKKLVRKLQIVQEQLELHAQRHEIEQELAQANDPEIERPSSLQMMLHENELKYLILTAGELQKKIQKLDRKMAEQERAPKTIKDRFYDSVSTYEASKDNLAAARDAAAEWARKHCSPSMPLPEKHRDPDRTVEPAHEHTFRQQNSLLRRSDELKQQNQEWEHFWQQRKEVRAQRREQRELAKAERNEQRRLKQAEQDHQNTPEFKQQARGRWHRLEHDLERINHQIKTYTPTHDEDEHERERER